MTISKQRHSDSALNGSERSRTPLPRVHENEHQPTVEIPVYLPALHVCRLLDIYKRDLDELDRKDPTFPRPVCFSLAKNGRKRWIQSEILEWIETRRVPQVIAQGKLSGELVRAGGEA